MDLAQARWRKSTYSGAETSCVEVTFMPGEVGVRDSKNPTGGMLALPEPAWQVLVRRI
jgi:hypothetical protein